MKSTHGVSTSDESDAKSLSVVEHVLAMEDIEIARERIANSPESLILDTSAQEWQKYGLHEGLIGCFEENNTRSSKISIFIGC
jgi:hypothetical protein